MQLSQKHAFWDITRQNRSTGLAPSWTKEQIKKHRPLTFHLFVGSPPEPIDMPFGVLSGVFDVIIHAKFYLNQLRGFSAAAPLKVPFCILIRRTLTIILHYRVDCDGSKTQLNQCENDVGTSYIIMVLMKPFVSFSNKTLIFRPLELEVIYMCVSMFDFWLIASDGKIDLNWFARPNRCD